MKIFLSQGMFAGFALAIYYFVHIVRSKRLESVENRLLGVFCLTSAIWSFGFWGVIIQNDPEKAYYWRAFGMIGTIGYLIIGAWLVYYLSGISKRMRFCLNAFSFLGIPVYFLTVQKGQTIYELSEIGMTYYFRAGLSNNIYTLYSIIMALNMLIVVLYMIIRGEKKRSRVLGQKLLVSELVIVFGMVFDTVLPLLGEQSVPGSTITQFLGLMVLYEAFQFMERSKVTIANMSEYIYYSLSMPVLVYDFSYELKILNDAALPFFGTTKGHRGRMNIESLFPISEKEVFTFDGQQKEVEAVCRNNNLYCSLSINKIYDDYGDIIGYIILITDLSEHKKAMKKMEEAKQEAEAANRAKSIFLANMSHEIRTPMNAIIGFSDLLLNMELQESARENIEDIKLASHNLLAIINDILDISKIESGKAEVLCDNYYTASLLRDISLIITMQAKGKGLAFCMDIDENLPNVLYGDKARIRGVLINVLNNAVKYTREGSVMLKARFQEEGADNVILKFEIIDTGIGIREEDKEKLFHNFERLDRRAHYKVEGSGLGLAITKGYVNAMGGEITVESTYGQGSTFTVILPQRVIDRAPMDGSYSHESGKAENLGRMQISGVHVLAVDDNQINVRVAQGILGTYGLTVDTASSGPEAIELCKKTDYDIVFMDEMMPEMNGVEAMLEIRKLGEHYKADGRCKIIVLTADAVSGARARLIGAGFDEYLGKPMNLKQLERLFTRFLSADKISWREEEKKEENKTALAEGERPGRESAEAGNTGTEENTADEEEICYLRETLAQVDVEQGIQNCGGSVEMYKEALKITSQYGRKQIAELEQLQMDKDYVNYTIKIHAAKSSIKNLGAEELSEMAFRQEMAGEQGDYAYIEQEAEKFRVRYGGLIDAVDSVLEHFQTQESGGEKEWLEERMILPVLSNIRAALETFQYPKVFEILEEVKNYNMPEKYQQIFGQIGLWMDELLVDDIEELLKKTLEE